MRRNDTREGGQHTSECQSCIDSDSNWIERKGEWTRWSVWLGTGGQHVSEFTKRGATLDKPSEMIAFSLSVSE